MRPRQRPHRSNQDYATPCDFIAAVQARLGIPAFVIDLAADAHNAQAETFLTAADDALTVRHWERLIGTGWGWLNPPFTRIAPWARRCVETRAAGGQIALLVPAGVGANWFRDSVHNHARVLFLNGRLGFLPERPMWKYPNDCILGLFSPTIEPGYEIWDWRRRGRPLAHVTNRERMTLFDVGVDGAAEHPGGNP